MSLHANDPLCQRRGRFLRLAGFAEDEWQLNLLVSMSRLLAWVLSAPPPKLARPCILLPCFHA